MSERAAAFTKRKGLHFYAFYFWLLSVKMMGKMVRYQKEQVWDCLLLYRISIIPPNLLFYRARNPEMRFPALFFTSYYPFMAIENRNR